MQTPTTTGKEIRKARKSADLLQSDMAEYLGVTQGFVSDLEKNRSRPNSVHLRDILRAHRLNKPDSPRPAFRLTVRGWFFEPKFLRRRVPTLAEVGQAFIVALGISRPQPDTIHARDILAAWNTTHPDQSESSFLLTEKSWFFEPGE